MTFKQATSYRFVAPPASKISAETIIDGLCHVAQHFQGGKIDQILSIALDLSVASIDDNVTYRYNALDSGEFVESLRELLVCAERIGNDDLAFILDAAHKLAAFAYCQTRRKNLDKTLAAQAAVTRKDTPLDKE